MTGTTSAPDRQDLPEGFSLRPATKADCRRIAELFRIASDGVVDYVWEQQRADYPGLTPLEIGERRYQREDTAFSYQNCLVVEDEGRVVGILHTFPMEPSDGPSNPVDPVLRPYAELEAPGSLYIAGVALTPEYRGRGTGQHLLAAARQRARALGLGELSLLVFADNEGAVRLYQRAGFQEVDRRPSVAHPLIRRTGDVLLMTAPV